jgi:adenosylcobinamide kinase / adenosylcobinamide-phosphate guanylyltransferase
VPQSQPAIVTLVLGGVRSGKSRYAQQIAARADNVTFIATAERRNDAEMHAKIERHRADRPKSWATIEEPLQLARTIEQAGRGSEVILIDCLTLFASNIFEACGDDTAQLQSHIDQLCTALHNAPCSIILVSNEVGSGVVPAYELGRKFRDLVGEINQRVALVSDIVLLMVAGLPLALKGSPSGEGQP